MILKDYYTRTKIIATLELVVLAIIAPLMLFPGRLAPAALLPILAIWIARRLALGRTTRPSLMNAPIVVLVLMAVVGFVVSADHSLSWPKLWGIVLQAAAFFAALNGLNGARDIRLMAFGTMLLTLSMSVVSLFGTNWDVVRLFPLPAFYDRIPLLIRNVPDSGLSPTQDLFHPRQVGATLGMLIPFLTAYATVARGWAERLSAFIALAFGCGVLLLTQSIMGMIGLLAGWTVLLAVWRPRLVWLALPIGLFAAAAVMGLTGNQPLMSRLLDVNDPVGIGVLLRLDMWSRALAMIADLPLTGIGLNTFPLIQSHFYIGHLIGAEPHAHNLVLQTAVDLGLPGLIALIWLIAAVVVTAQRVWTQSRNYVYRALAAGVCASVCSYVVGGTLDVMTLGSKPLVALFLLLGMLGAIEWCGSREEMLVRSEALPSRTAFGRVLPLIAGSLLIVGLLVARPAMLKTNLALLESNRKILAARQGKSLSQPAVDAVIARLSEAIESDPTNPELFAALGNGLTWASRTAEALDSWEQRVNLDQAAPYGRYAPFLGWGPAAAHDSTTGEQLLQVYRQWQVRFPERAEGHMLVAIAAETVLGQRSVAINAIMAGQAAGARPAAIMSAYLERLTDAGNESREVVDGQ